MINDQLYNDIQNIDQNQDNQLNGDGPDFDNDANNETAIINNSLNETQMLYSQYKNDDEYDKKYGRLYKTFDVRYLKSKIWDSINKQVI
jgi:hypothetical protein